MTVYLFDLIPAWEHKIKFVEISEDNRELLTDEAGGLIKSWIHLIKVEQGNEQDSTFYTDQVDIQAGIFTPIVWMFSNILYRYRQRRWKKLLKLTAGMD